MNKYSQTLYAGYMSKYISQHNKYLYFCQIVRFKKEVYYDLKIMKEDKLGTYIDLCIPQISNLYEFK